MIRKTAYRVIVRETGMKPLAFVLSLVLVWAAAGCLTDWVYEDLPEAQVRKQKRVSPYMPTIHDEERIRQAKQRRWQEVHVPKTGLVGYLATQREGLYTVEGPRDTYRVYDADIESIGFITERGSAYRYIFDDYKKTKKYIGHYEIEEGVAHLLKVPVEVELKPLSAKPPKF